jgi:hypothetical protein
MEWSVCMRYIWLAGWLAVSFSGIMMRLSCILSRLCTSTFRYWKSSSRRPVIPNTSRIVTRNAQHGKLKKEGNGFEMSDAHALEPRT